MAGADANVERTGDGATPLWSAAILGYADVAAALVLGGADVNARRAEDGGNPLLASATYGRTDCARLLIEAKAHLGAENHAGQTPMNVAIGRNNHAIAGMLLNASRASLLERLVSFCSCKRCSASPVLCISGGHFWDHFFLERLDRLESFWAFLEPFCCHFGHFWVIYGHFACF